MPSASVERLKLKSLAEAARERIMRFIARGELKPGDRLNEAQMAQRLGVSRGPIREAARELEGQGFFVSRPNQGFYVVTLTPGEIRDICEAKDWLEAAFISDLAQNMGISQRREILSELDALDGSNGVAFTETLFQFRQRVLAMLRNRFLADLMTTLYRKFYIISVLVDIADERGGPCIFWTCNAASGRRWPTKISTARAQSCERTPPIGSPTCRLAFPPAPTSDEDNGMNAPVKNSIAALVPELTQWRRDFHRHPELLYEVGRTAALVARRLAECGFDEVHEGIGRTGVVGLLHGANGPAKGARSALCCAPTWTRCRSSKQRRGTTPPKTPAACTPAATMATPRCCWAPPKHLAETRDFDGTLVFCFQPAEEGVAGALAMIEDGFSNAFR